MNKNIKITLGSIYLIILITFLYFLLSKFDTSRISDFSYYKEIQINLEEIIGENLIVNLILFSVFSVIWVVLLGFGSPLLILSGILFGKWVGTTISTVSISVGALSLYIIASYFFKDLVNQILKNKFKDIREPLKEDICYATTNRQMAVKNIAKNCDMFFVIGSRNSSNSVRLVEVAIKSGCINSRLIHSESKIPYDEIQNSNTIGISSGASAPEILVENFINALKNRFTIKIDEVEIIKENIVFKIPNKLN